jgi:hypothetical protein
MYFWDVADFAMKIVQNEDIKLLPHAFKCLSSLIANSNMALLFITKYDIHGIGSEML